MTLNDLENTMVVQMRNQQLYLVITDCLPPNASKNKDIVFLSQGGYMQGTSYTFNMLMTTDDERYREWDIIKVFKRVYSMLDLVCIWDREKDACQEEIVNDNDFVSEQDEYSSKEVELKLNAPNQTESRTY